MTARRAAIAVTVKGLSHPDPRGVIDRGAPYIVRAASCTKSPAVLSRGDSPATRQPWAAAYSDSHTAALVRVLWRERRSSPGMAVPRVGRLSRQDGSMATVHSGVPGHDDGTAFVRLRRGKLVDGPSGQRVWDNTTEGPYEVVCPGCGDDPGRDWSSSPRNCAESGAFTARRQGPRPHSWITSACRRAEAPAFPPPRRRVNGPAAGRSRRPGHRAGERQCPQRRSHPPGSGELAAGPRRQMAGLATVLLS